MSLTPVTQSNLSDKASTHNLTCSRRHWLAQFNYNKLRIWCAVQFGVSASRWRNDIETRKTITANIFGLLHLLVIIFQTKTGQKGKERKLVIGCVRLLHFDARIRTHWSINWKIWTNVHIFVNRSSHSEVNAPITFPTDGHLDRSHQIEDTSSSSASWWAARHCCIRGLLDLGQPNCFNRNMHALRHLWQIWVARYGLSATPKTFRKATCRSFPPKTINAIVIWKRVVSRPIVCTTIPILHRRRRIIRYSLPETLCQSERNDMPKSAVYPDHD